MASMIMRRDAARMAASAVLALGLPLPRAAAVLRRGVGAAPGLPGGADSAWPHLPRGVSRREFDKALGGFAKVVGEEWVFRSEQDVALYRDAYSIYWGEGEEKVASAAVAPRTTQEVVEIVRVANRHGIPLYPISTGKNLGYGGSAPVLSGSVVLDLKRMDRVLEVNERHAYALVEPGVSYLDLHQYIRERGLKVWIDCPGPGWGSVIGNSLDRGVGYTLADFRNHFEAHCGMEVVLPTGELMRTGMGAMPNAETWQQFKPGYGPWVDGLFSQSNFGIVTKMGFWLMPQPEAFGTGRVGVPRYRDMITLVDVISRLEAGHIVRGFMSFSSPIAGIGMPGGPDGALSSQHDPEIASLLSDPGGLSAQKLEAIGLRKGIPFWSCDFNFYGPQKLIEAQWGCVQDAFASLSGAKCEWLRTWTMPPTPQQVDSMRDTVYLGVPTLKTFDLGPMTSYRGVPVVGHIFCSPVVPRTGEAVLEAESVFGAIMRRHQLPAPPLQFPSPVFERSFIFVIGLPVTRDKEVNSVIRGAYGEIMQAARQRGWGEYRSPTSFYDEAMSSYSFNDQALLRFHETLKDALDPNGILSAGRYGIWPAHLRGSR